MCERGIIRYLFLIAAAAAAAAHAYACSRRYRVDLRALTSSFAQAAIMAAGPQIASVISHILYDVAARIDTCRAAGRTALISSSTLFC